MDDCSFCKIVRGEIPCFKVYEDGKVLAFEDINPVAEGHTLIIPKKHAKDLWEIAGEDLIAIHLASKQVIRGIKDTINPVGVAALQLNGKGANQVIMHYHLHLIPRKSGHAELPMTSWDMKQGDMEIIKQTAERIARAINAL